MTRSVVASLTIALLFGGVVLLPASPALAKKKKASSDEPAVQATDESPAPGKTADQVGDTEKPKIDPGHVAGRAQDRQPGPRPLRVPERERDRAGRREGDARVQDQDLPGGPLLRDGAAHHLQRAQGRLHRRGGVRQRQAGVAAGDGQRERGDGVRAGRRAGAQARQRPRRVRRRDDAGAPDVDQGLPGHGGRWGHRRDIVRHPRAQGRERLREGRRPDADGRHRRQGAATTRC